MAAAAPCRRTERQRHQAAGAGAAHDRPHTALLPLSKARRERRLLCTLLTQGDSDIKRREQERRKKTTPSTTLFVVNFDVIRTRERDLADLFGRYGPLRRVQVRFVGQHNGHKADP